MDRTVGLHLEFAHPAIYIIIVIRIVLKRFYLVEEPFFSRMPETEIRAVGVERTVRVGGVYKPVASPFVCHDIDYPSYGVRTETHWHYTLVDLDSFGETRRNVVQVERLPCSLLRHTVNEDLNVFATESV